MALNLESASNINASSFNSTQYVTVKLYQSESNHKYYRLKLTAAGVADMYIYLGQYVTNPNYVYTHTFGFNDTQNVYSHYSGSLHQSSFEAYFRQYFTDIYAPQFSVILQSSTSSSFSSNVTSSAQSRTLSIVLTGNNFSPTWVAPTYVDTKYSTSPGIQALTRSPYKGAQSVSDIAFTFESATPQYGATISKYTMNIEGAFVRSYTPPQIRTPKHLDLSLYPNLSGYVKVTFTAEDSRGFTRSFDRLIQIVPYNKVELVVNNTHRQSNTGTTVILDFEGKWYGDTTKLTLSCNGITAYEEGSQTPFATITPTPTIDGKSFYIDDLVWSGVSFDQDKGYTIVAEFNDGVTTVDLTLPIPIYTPVLSIRNKKVGINNSQPQSALDVNGVIQQNGLPVMGYMGEIGTAESCNFNDYTETGFYFYNGNSAQISNSPSGFIKTHKALLMTVKINSTHIVQRLYNLSLNTSAFRTRDNSWNSWTV